MTSYRGEPTPPTTAAGPRTASRRWALPLMNQMLLEAAESAHYMSAGVNGHPSPSLSFMECRIAECEKRREWAWDHTAEARQQDGSALRAALERLANVVLDRPFADPDDDAAVAARAALAALPSSTPPALDAERLAHKIGPRIGMVLGMIEPMEREEAGRPGHREWLDVDEAWAILLDVRHDLAEYGRLKERER